METNFFSQLQGLAIRGTLQVGIAEGAEGRMVVSVLVQDEGCRDEAKRLIPPLTLSGTPEELDHGFFQRIAQPVQAASGLLDNMREYMEQIEIAKSQSKGEKDKGKAEKQKEQKADRQVSDREKKYADAMKKAEELSAQGRYREAYMKVPKPDDFPEYEKEIRAKWSEFSSKFSPDLFGTPQATTPENATEVRTESFAGADGEELGEAEIGASPVEELLEEPDTI